MASGVTNKLHYLVIGDEGSPLYGHGKKGDKQVKGEELNAAGANIKIISETAFLKMLAGSAGAGQRGRRRSAGCAALGDGRRPRPGRRAAVAVRHQVHPAATTPTSPWPRPTGRSIPARRSPPSSSPSSGSSPCSARPASRSATSPWSWPAGSSPAGRRRPTSCCGWPRTRTPTSAQFVAEALLADDAPEHRRYRIDPETLGPAAVFRFCESGDESTRALGMQLIGRSPRFRVPEELFRLTESPDRRVRAFVIRTLWSLYRDRGITDDWKPSVPPAATLGAAAKKAAVQAEVRGAGGPGRPDQLPADVQVSGVSCGGSCSRFRPAGPEAVPADAAAGERSSRLPARKAKLALIEIMRDLALEDAEFAAGCCRCWRSS